MNGLLLGATALPVAGLAGPFLAFFVPPRCGKMHTLLQPIFIIVLANSISFNGIHVKA